MQTEIPPHEPMRWPHCVNLVLGMWLLAAPATLGYQSAPLAWSDVMSGVWLLAFAALSLNPRYFWAPWGACGVGLWLLLAPLIFHAPTAAVYASDTLIGSFVIALAIIIPGVPGAKELPGPEIPPGWSYNPSGWLQRAPIIALALVGFFLARYLAAFQLGHLSSVWDPFFPGGTQRVLESDVSRAFPVSDAGLGAVSYLLEALTGFLGGTRRWRTMPWLVIVFGILVVPLGVVSIVLITLQPLVVGAWCTLCLATAVAMLIMVAPAADEVIATSQFLMQSRRQGQSVWHVFWHGGAVESSKADEPAPSRSSLAELISAFDLASAPWNLLLSAALGVWLMFAPAALGFRGAAANLHQLMGALIVTVSVIALGEVLRSARYVNVLLAAGLAAAPWFMDDAPPSARYSAVAAGIVVALLAVRRGKITERFGGWNRWIF